MACSQARTATSEALSLLIDPSACSNGLRRAAIQAARHVSRRVASMSAARSASGNETPWFSMIAWAATMGRVRSKAPSAPSSAARPLAIRSRSRSSPPSSRSAGTRQPSSAISPVCEARQPSLSSLRSIVSPGVPFGTTNTPWPRCPASGSTVATTTCRPLGSADSSA